MSLRDEKMMKSESYQETEIEIKLIYREGYVFELFLL